MSNMKAFGSVAFGKWLNPEDGTLMNGISALIKETLETSLALFHCMMLQETMAIYEEEAASHQTLNLLHPNFRLPSLQHCE